MRKLSSLVGAIVIAAGSAATASAQSSHFQGFGGVTFGDVTNSSTFGGTLAVPLSDNLQIVGEGGRMTDLMPSLLGTIVDLTPVDVRVSAWYGEGGLRFIATPGRAIRPYVETTAGFARVTTGFNGAGSRADAIVNAGLGFLGRTEPLLGAGGGVVVQGGPVFLDLGYRYKRILAGDSLQTLLTGGEISVNQVRIGAGVRF
jgi:opacity protein-like surface antigen